MSDELTWLPAWQIREKIGKREVSCREVLEHFLGRIEEWNATLRAFAEIDHAGARAQADRADQAVREGEPLGLFHGLPTG